MINNPKQRQEWIFELLKKEVISYVEMWAKYGQKWAKGKTTFDKDWNKANARSLQYQSKVNSAKETASIEIEVEALKQGLKTKIDRLLFYQNQIDIMEKQLFGEIKFMFIVGNKPVSSHNSKNEFILPLEKQNEIRKQIKDYQTEISKIEGDYFDKTLILKGDKENPLVITNSEEREARIAQLIAKATKQD